MRVLLITQRYHPYIGGIETHVRQVALALAHEHRVQVAAVNFRPGTAPPPWSLLDTSLLAPSFPDYVDGPVPVHAITPSPMERLRLAPMALRTVPALRSRHYHRLERTAYRWYRRVFIPKLWRVAAGAQLVHALAGGYIGWAAQEVARTAGVPFVCTPFVHPHQWGDGPHDVAYYKRCDAVIALVPTDRNYLVSLGVSPERVHVIGVSPDLPPTTDPQGFRQRHLLGDAPIILYVGRMMPQKGAEAVLRCAEHVWRQFPATCFVFVGPGTPESAAWFDGADPRILSLGKVDAQEKADALAACDVFCMPSLSEILPTVYLEAWSLGKPVIGGLAHGLPELVEGRGAGVCVGQEPEAVAAALTQLLQDPERRACHGQRGQALVQEQYSVAAVTRALSHLYAELLTNPPAS